MTNQIPLCRLDQIWQVRLNLTSKIKTYWLDQTWQNWHHSDTTVYVTADHISNFTSIYCFCVSLKISNYFLSSPSTFQPCLQTFSLKKKKMLKSSQKLEKERRQLCDVIYFTHNLLLLAFTQHITFTQQLLLKSGNEEKKSDNHQEGTWVASHGETNKTFWHRRKRKTFSFTNQNETFFFPLIVFVFRRMKSGNL